MRLGDTKTCVYQFLLYKYGSNETYIIQHFVMHGLGLRIKLNSYVGHMLYAW